MCQAYGRMQALMEVPGWAFVLVAAAFMPTLARVAADAIERRSRRVSASYFGGDA